LKGGEMMNTTVQLPKEIVNEYTILAVKMGMRRGDVIRLALKEFLDKNKDN
jgi:metal-responsive CopG/Arc/MetJ family transcriptional regulator